MASIFAWSRGLAHRAKLDDNPELMQFTRDLERACVEVVDEKKKMTKDLAMSVYGSK